MPVYEIGFRKWEFIIVIVIFNCKVAILILA